MLNVKTMITLPPDRGSSKGEPVTGCRGATVSNELSPKKKKKGQVKPKKESLDKDKFAHLFIKSFKFNEADFFISLELNFMSFVISAFEKIIHLTFH